MNKIKKGLGRGLSSLIGEITVESKTNRVLLSDIVPNKFQPRKDFDQENLEDLTNSIKERGVIQPIIVRKSNLENFKYEIIAGERRWLASRKAGLHDIPVVITNADDLKSLEFAIVENVQRHDLNPLEEARGYKRLINEFSYDQEKVGKFIGKSRSHIANIIRLLNLPASIQDMISQGIITSGHARAIMNSAFPEELAKKIVDENLSVRQAESLVKEKKTKPPKNKLKPADTVDLEQRLTELLGLDVVISDNGKRGGSIKVKYKTLDQLELVTNKLKK